MNTSRVLNLQTKATSDSPHPLVDRASRPHGTRIKLGTVEVGGRDFAVIADPCAVEGEAALERVARMAVSAGVPLLRGGAFKQGTSRYSFQGLGQQGLSILHNCGRALGLPIITEVISPNDVSLVEQHADMLQVGARNMQNYALLAALGQARKPVLLERDMSATIEEWLVGAENILRAGNRQVILCECGIRTAESMMHNALDLSAVALAKRLTHLPVLVDLSYDTGCRELALSLANAALAVGADGIIVEVHPEPDTALSDGAHSLDADLLHQLMQNLRRLAPLHARRLPTPNVLSPCEQLEDGRRRIDDLDEALTALLEERARVARNLGGIKRGSGRPLRNVQRETEVLAHVRQLADGGLSPGALERIFQSIIGEMLRAEERDCN